LFSGDAVKEFQILGVQEISSIAGQAGEISRGWPVKPYRGSPTRGWSMDARGF
jgi:hypothetical protein